MADEPRRVARGEETGSSRFEALIRVSRLLSATLELPRVLQTAIDSACDVLGLETGAIYELEGGMLVLGATTPPLPPGFPDEFRRAPLEDHPHIGRALATGEPVFVRDTSQEEFTPAERAICEARRLRTILYVPLLVEGQAVGVVIVGSTTGAERELTDEDRAVCEALAGQIALAIANARLYRSVEDARRALAEHNERLESLVAERTRELAEANEELEAANAELEAMNEELQRMNIELAEMSAAKSRFFAKASHELRTPLTAIIGFGTILGRGMAGELSPEQRLQIDMIVGAARHLLALIDDLLDLARLEAGRIEITLSDFDAGRTVEDVAEACRPLALEKGLRLETEVPQGGCPVRQDEMRFRQILTNLVGNAIKYTEEGEVRVRLRATCDDRVAVEVHDTGCGIAEDEIDVVFQPFSRAYAVEASGAVEGVGLGLTLVKELAELLGGSVTAQSEVGRGSVFTVELPREAASGSGMS